MSQQEIFDMRIMRLKEVIEFTALGRSTIYRFIAEGHFPKPVPLGGRAVGWLDSEVEDWVMDKIAQRDDGEQLACV